MAATYGGANIFGGSVSVEHAPNPAEFQINAYFGVAGTFSLFGGTRGRGLVVRGVAQANDPTGLGSFEANILSYTDGIGRELADVVKGVIYPSVVFTGVFRWTGPYGRAGGLWFRSYEAVFEGRL